MLSKQVEELVLLRLGFSHLSIPNRKKGKAPPYLIL